MNNFKPMRENGYIRLLLEENNSLPSIIVAGDLCPMGKSEEFLSTSQVEWLFPGVIQTLQRADLAIVNLECPLTHHTTPIVKSGPHLKANPACAKGIRSAGFDVVSLANNHILDMGGKGLADTVAACTNAGLKTIGVGENLAKATCPLWIDVRSLKVAILAFAENEFSIATRHTPGAWPVDPLSNYYQIKQAKQKADFVLVLLHGGNEYYELPSPNLIKLCRYYVDLGVNAVICNHIHVPGCIEIYDGVPIIYSSGNFLFEANDAVDGWYKGFLVKLSIQSNAVVGIRLIPYWQSKDQVGVKLMEQSEQRQFLNHIFEISSLLADPAELVKKWDLFVNSKRIQYLSAVLGLNKVERQLLKFGIWPSWRLKRSARAGLLNLFTCEAHRDVMISLLSSEFMLGESCSVISSEEEVTQK